MDKDNHPITPPPDLVREWIDNDDFQFLTGTFDLVSITKDRLRSIATQAARWGADKELKACCEVLENDLSCFVADDLRAARRPKPKSQVEEAIAELDGIMDELHEATGSAFTASIIRAALERLRELEQSNG